MKRYKWHIIEEDYNDFVDSVYNAIDHLREHKYNILAVIQNKEKYEACIITEK